MEPITSKMFARIKGTNCSGQNFSEDIAFTLLPHDGTSPKYGTGYYMRVVTPYDALLVDVRYAKTTDIEILADRWIKEYYGTNAEEIWKQFPVHDGQKSYIDKE